jgi:nitrite reductase/ring-hydroxylating ferredoxin subunit
MAHRASWIGSDFPTIYRNNEEYFLLMHCDAFYLVRNQCPHRGGPLKFGFINERDEIVCPMHHNAYAISCLIDQASTVRLRENPGVPT